MNSWNVETVRLLWNRRRQLQRAAVAGLVIGTLIAFLLPVEYEATAQLMPPDAQSLSGMTMLAALSSKVGPALEGVSSDLLGLKSSGAVFIGILNSRTVADRLIAKLNLRQAYGCKLEEDARKKLAANTRTWEDRHSGIISIVVRDHNGERSAALAAAYVDELNRLVTELSTSAAHRERVFLEQRLATVKTNLDSASAQLSDFASRNTTIDPKEQGRAMIDVAANLTGQLLAAESELSGLEQIYSAKNVRVRAVEARVASLRIKLAELGGQTQANAGPTQTQEPYPSLRKLPLLGVTYANLYRETKIQESVYETLNAEYELAKVQEAKETPSVKILDAPAVPENRAFPPRLQIVFVSMCLGLSAQIAGTLARNRWRSVDESDPAKAFVREVWANVRTSAAPVGARAHAAKARILAWYSPDTRRPAAVEALLSGEQPSSNL